MTYFCSKTRLTQIKKEVLELIKLLNFGLLELKNDLRNLINNLRNSNNRWPNRNVKKKSLNWRVKEEY
ncbi:hypothetical protein BpHYR1_017361 [Brachionus plicatilis]|uniref:Uncharacterized protein n=1 Tax=Brachionus plicatilis TaxID=10195 RepID=A0A3M7QVC2_BRAPC|nr:hypothetical protein BpHYR1_017361 [Brachionus plicatilis]